MGAYKLVIFDFDGTLADSFGWFMKSIHVIAQRYHFKVPDLDQMDELRGYSSRQMMAYLGIAWWKLPLMVHQMRRMMNEQVNEVKPFPGAAQLLRDLHDAAVEIAIVTSNSQKNVEAILGPESMALVGAISCGTALYSKHVRFNRVLKQCGCAPGAALCVGDEIRDAEAATASGIDFLGVAWGFTTPAGLQKYTRLPICTHIEEILAIATGEMGAT